MPELIPVLEKDDIEKMVIDIARKISDDYRGRELVLIGVLNGAFVFMSDLIRQISVPVQVDFVRVSSYGAGTSSSGRIHLSKEIDSDIEGKDVLLVEDIVDTGLTVEFLINYLKSFNPSSIKVCTFLNKQERRERKIMLDYQCYSIKGFVVGYGLDYNGNYRGLPGIYDLKF